MRADGVIVPVDWRAAGSYPGYWEYCTNVIIPSHHDHWTESVDEIFEAMELVAKLGCMGHYCQHIAYLYWPRM